MSAIGNGDWQVHDWQVHDWRGELMDRRMDYYHEGHEEHEVFYR